MKSPLETIPNLEETIRQLRNIDAKLDAGRIIRAYRENGKLLAYFEKTKSDIITEAKKKNLLVSDFNLIGQIQDLEEIIRQLHKINSLIYVGQIVAASGNINKLMTLVAKRHMDINFIKELKYEK